MKRLSTLLLALVVAGGLSAQVNVTFKVDITEYLAGGATLSADGMRIGGNFADNAAENGGTAMVSWTPSDANSAMTDEGSNVWSITVTFPAESVGNTQLFKFVNGDWGTNEGTSGSTIADDGCGVDDGAGNINREMVVPAEDVTYLWCYDSCFTCDGNDPLQVTGIDAPEAGLSNIEVFPTPATYGAVIAFEAATERSYDLTLTNTVGQVVLTQPVLGNRVFVERNGLPAGVYFATLSSANGANATVRVVFR
jgi:hypothetical protein